MTGRLVNTMNVYQTENPAKSNLVRASAPGTWLLTLAVGFTLAGASGCGRTPSAPRKKNAALAAETTAIAQATSSNGGAGAAHSVATNSYAQRLEAELDLMERAMGGGLTNMDEEAIACFVGMFPEPAAMDTVLWEKYMSEGNSSTYAVAEQIFRWVVEKCPDERSQAYARNHLGRVLERQGRLEEALAMYESVQLQTSGEDFWYVDAKDEAGMIAYKLIGAGAGGFEAIKEQCERAERNYLLAIAATQYDNVRASLYYKLGHVYINTDPNKAQSAWRKAYHLARLSGKDNLAAEAKEAYNSHRLNATFANRLEPENKEPL